MKRKLLSVLLAAALLVPAVLVLNVTAQAAEGSMTYYPTSCVRNGISFEAGSEYVVLDPDGSGMVVYSGNAYWLTWEAGEGGAFTFTDSRGKSFSGVLSGQTLEGNYRTCDYVYELGADAPVLSLKPGSWGKGLLFVTDQADILTDGEEAELSARAAEISGKYGCNVYIVTLDDLRNFSRSSNVELCAEEIRTGYDLGYGSGRDTVMLLLSMAERDYDLVAFGDFGNASFTDYGKDYLAKCFLDDFRDNDWMEGFSDYLACCDELLKASSEGAPVDVGDRPDKAPLPLSLVMSLLVSFPVAFIVCAILRGSMKKTRIQTTAEEYVPDGGVQITHRYDRYTHTTETRVYDPPKSSGGGGGGGGTSIGSSGHSHSSGKF